MQQRDGAGGRVIGHRQDLPGPVPAPRDIDECRCVRGRWIPDDRDFVDGGSCELDARSHCAKAVGWRTASATIGARAVSAASR